ncbi:hypothetical protein F6X51_17855 [Methylobacterium planeticum]|uniref:(5-formylfuran-3-yl)methyl phosphate synthase n=1 Tax=Methylobacterium planeticum TaxID=2615211 RepID=A0A6N6MPV1_9HYPH|nr:(5-formylfuran-3-yl)methyl phosphate synthase [Methylobacterium planeticum]KAB1072064.1 hypothetical protein F6X51_17855 [Methylobacterium planeticum]
MTPSVPALPRLLVSVRDAAEAEIAAASGADLVDAKDPVRGALGALEPGIVRAIVAAVRGRAATSAVAGEPDDAETLARCVAAMAATGVDYVKVAVSPTLRAEPKTLAAAARAAPERLIAVLFAEDALRPEDPARLAAAGFIGAMIDTAGKDGRRLPDLLDAGRRDAFTAACRACGLVSGLAGSLGIEDIPVLAGRGSGEGPGYLGFRGGLCRGGRRTERLDPARVAAAVADLRALARRTAA